jgi:hypothetical protein
MLPKFRTISRMFSNVPAKGLRQWPFIDRPALSKSVIDRMTDKSPSICWVLGGTGCGKTELMYRCIDRVMKTSRKNGSLVLTVDLVELVTDGQMSDNDKVADLIRTALIKQVSSQLPPSEVLAGIRAVSSDVDTRFRDHALSKPLWSHFARTTTDVTELWNKLVVSPSVAVDTLSVLIPGTSSIEQLSSTVSMISSLSHNVSMSIMHVEHVSEGSIHKHPLLSSLIHPSFNVMIECNDSFVSMWSICDESAGRDQNIIEVEDLPKEAVKSVFVPSLLNDDEQLEVLYSVCGGRVAELEKLIVPLNIMNEQQKIEDMKQEQKYKAGRENRPSADSKELQVDPLIHKRDVLISNTSIDGAFSDETAKFVNSIDNLVTEFEPLAGLRSGMSTSDFRLLVVESVKIICASIRKNGCLPIPSNMSPMDIAHPVVLALMSENILMIKWVPYPRIVADSPLKLFLLESWAASQHESLSMHERIQYNATLLKNRKHLIRQLEKLKR